MRGVIAANGSTVPSPRPQDIPARLPSTLPMMINPNGLSEEDGATPPALVECPVPIASDDLGGDIGIDSK